MRRSAAEEVEPVIRATGAAERSSLIFTAESGYSAIKSQMSLDRPLDNSECPLFPLYTGDTNPAPAVKAAAMAGAAQGFNCAKDCIACMNKKLAAGTLIIVGGGGVAYGGTPRPVAEWIAGGRGLPGTYLKSGVRSVGIRLAHQCPCGGSLAANAGERIIQHANKVEDAFKSGRLARGGVIAISFAEIKIAGYCEENCRANPAFTCPPGFLSF